MHTVEVPEGMPRGHFADRWHSDVSYVANPPYASILRPVVLPSIGGDTLWANMYAVYEAMPEPLQQLVSTLNVRHEAIVGGVVSEYVHPAVRVNPKTGRRALYVNDTFSREVKGYSSLESRKLIDLLLGMPLRADVQVRYRWTPDTVAMWDNRFTQHYGTRDYTERRLLHRMTIIGEPVLGPHDNLQAPRPASQVPASTCAKI